MVHTVKMDSEERGSHLAENEVARLLSVLQNAEFKRSETRNIIKDGGFKPRSLMEIAVEAQQRDAGIEAVRQSEEALAVAKRAETASASRTQAGNGQNRNNPILNNQESATDKDSDEASILAGGAEAVRLQTASSDSSQSPNIDACPNLTQDMMADMRSDDKFQDFSGDIANRALTNDSLGNGVTEHDLVADDDNGDAAQDAQIAANFETVTAAFERGKAEGIITGREEGIAETIAAAEAEAQANLADKIAAFEAALVALAKPQALQAEDLSRSIHAAILKLASQRAGQQIDEMPKNFLARIEALVTSIGQKMAAGKIHINADDYKVMLPYLADAHFDFVAEPSLARGDIILKFAGVELHDIAESRLGGQYAESLTGKVEATRETADLVAEPTPLESTPSESTPMPLESTPSESTPMPLESTPSEATQLETTQAQSAPKIRMMTTVRPLVTDNAEPDTTKGDQLLPSPDEKTS
ncbi:flagellar assembly protein FliH [Alphaproteobacteria bacterium]|nr:flagellar assembly protein FliH [Alphaproteobacteria bacterium]